jgi:hypothetical protein
VLWECANSHFRSCSTPTWGGWVEELPPVEPFCPRACYRHGVLALLISCQTVSLVLSHTCTHMLSRTCTYTHTHALTHTHMHAFDTLVRTRHGDTHDQVWSERWEGSVLQVLDRFHDMHADKGESHVATSLTLTPCTSSTSSTMCALGEDGVGDFRLSTSCLMVVATL